MAVAGTKQLVQAWSPSQWPGRDNDTALVQTRGQGSPAQALGFTVKVGESAVLTAGTAGLGGTQVTN